MGPRFWNHSSTVTSATRSFTATETALRNFSTPHPGTGRTGSIHPWPGRSAGNATAAAHHTAKRRRNDIVPVLERESHERRSTPWSPHTSAHEGPLHNRGCWVLSGYGRFSYAAIDRRSPRRPGARGARHGQGTPEWRARATFLTVAIPSNY